VELLSRENLEMAESLKVSSEGIRVLLEENQALKG
jgi:hypothetical protein